MLPHSLDDGLCYWQLADTRDLIESLLVGAPELQPDASPMTMKDFSELRGVVIGGHQIFTNKLRKILPQCLFYSVDQRKIDDAAVRDRNFILFFAGYCTHTLADNVLRIAGTYQIPCGYTEHVNIPMCLSEVTRLQGRTSGGGLNRAR
jgi:hypothetical protein